MILTFVHVRQAFAVFLCLTVFAWSAVPSTAHAPKIFETIQDHLEIIADHGHSHGFEEDLYWAMHGHSHDTTDHDHSQAFISVSGGTSHAVPHLHIWWMNPSPRIGRHAFLIERPPRG